MRYPATKLLVLAAPVIFTACASMNPPQPPSLDLPKPATDLRAVRKGNRVMLTWTVPDLTTDRQTIRSVGPTRVCRSVESQITQCGTPVGEVPPSSTSGTSGRKVAGSFTDTLPADLPAAVPRDAPSAEAIYAVEVLNRNGRSAGLSNPARVSLIRTLPPPRDFQARVSAEGVVLSWVGEAPPPSDESIHYIVRVYRNLLGNQQRTVVGEKELGGEHGLTDSGIEWEKTYDYCAETVTVIRQPNRSEVQVEGEDTPAVKVFADDVFPPGVPSGLQAASSGPGQQLFVDLIWAPVTDLDLAGYNVYRREEGTSASRLNSEPLKTPAYRDDGVVAGKTYFYSVTAVDARGNESAHSEEAREASQP